MAEASQLLEIVRAIRAEFSAVDVSGLRRSSTRAIEACALDDGEETFLASLISYMLSKLLSKPQYWSAGEKSRFNRAMSARLGACEQALAQSDVKKYSTCAKGVLNAMRELELADPRFVHDLEARARTKLAARLYAQGFSLGLAAEITSVHKTDLLSYSGRTLMTDRSGRTKGISERLASSRQIFSETRVRDAADWTC